MHPSQESSCNGSNDTTSFHRTQQLLGGYPFASVTPSTHVARHLSNLSLTAPPPSYIQPPYYSTPTGYGRAVPYQSELVHLSTMDVPRYGSERAYWDASRSDLFRSMANHSISDYYPDGSLERNILSASSSYQLSPFAQSVVQHEAPYNAYPTPPPAPVAFSSSSSSLANALGSPTVNKTELDHDFLDLKINSNDSTRFFNTFLNERLEKLPKAYQAEGPYSSPRPESNPPSPDPLCIGSLTESPLPQGTSQASPKKRKLLEVLIETPTKQSSGNKSFLSFRPSPVTDGSARERNKKSGTPSRTPRMQAYVEIIPKYSNTPLRSRAETYVSSPDLGGYGIREDAGELRLQQGERSPGKRTGERDGRVPLEKFLNLVDEIFEVDDNVSPDGETSSLPASVFSPLSTDPTRPLLHPTVIIRLTKSIGKVARPTKRLRLASGHWDGATPGSPRKSGGMAEVDIQTLTRLLRLLERSLQVGEDLEPFGSVDPSRSGANNSVLASSAANNGVHDRPVSTGKPGPAPGRSQPDSAEAASEFTADDLAKLERSLEMARESILAADCCLALLTSDRLAKQLFSEDLISSCLTVTKNFLTRIIYPFVEAPSLDSRDFPPLLLYILNRSPENSQPADVANHRRVVGDIFQVVTSVFPRINSLICSDGLTMPETIIIPAVYIAIGPFFVIEASPDGDTRVKKNSTASIIAETLGTSGMRGLRLEALSLVRSIFAYHEDQRSWIIEEILTSLVRLSDSKQKAGVFRLRDGRSIRTVSALLLQLVQTSSHSVRVQAHRLGKLRQQQLALRRHDSVASAQESPADQLAIEEAGLYSSGLEAPTKAAKTIVVFLTQRSGRGKSTKNTNELEYRSILDNLISDLLVVLFWPEWPAASLVLSIVCKYMISSLDDVKTSNSDNNASKALALDHLGVIAARLRGNTLRWRRLNVDKVSNENSTLIKSLDDLVLTVDDEGLERLIGAHQEISSHLSKRSAEDHAYESARELNAVMWGQELATALIQLGGSLESPDGENLDLATRIKYGALVRKIKGTLQDIWNDVPTDVFDNTTQEEIDRADRLSQQLGITRALKSAFDPILNVIVLALDAPIVFVRTKALRALSHILTVDTSVLSKANVRHAIESHLLDSSPQVRDAAVELIGKYMIDSPVVAGEYYQKIAERIADTGIGVRKRVIKLLKAYYSVTCSLDRKIDSCSKLILRMLDEDDTVKDLSVKTLEELWFHTAVATGQSDRGAVLATIAVIMGVCGIFKDRQSPLEEMLGRIVGGKEGTDESTTSAVRARFSQIYDAMVEGLIDASDFMNFTVTNCIRAIHLFTSAFPSVMTGIKASVLLPYLKNSASSEDIIASDYILKIFRASIPQMSKTSVKFGQELQSILQPMVLKPNLHGTSLQEVVACLCIVVQHLTHESGRIVALLKSCIARLRQFATRSGDSLGPNEARTLQILVVIVSLLGEHFEFDQLRAENTELSNQLDSISKGPIMEHIYTCLLQLYEKYTDGSIRGRLLICLGFLFRAQPTLMTLESSAMIMDAIFSSPEDDNRARLLRLMQEFLASESSKHMVQQTATNKANLTKPGTGIDMEELVGNTQGFAESGVSSAVVQRYLSRILDAALSPVAHVQSSAVDILSFTVKQGLAHPLLSFPVIVALETSPNSSLSMRAVALHTVLHHKHASLLNSGFVAACRKSYDYQSNLYGAQRVQPESEVRGFRMQPTPVALLGRWYALVREKRAMRQEFLRSVLKVFELRDVQKTDGDTVQFVRYMAENFASFDYRTQEEVLTVLKTVTRELAEAGALLVERVAPGNLLTQLRPKDREGENPTESAEPTRRDLTSLDVEVEERLALIRSTCVIGVIMLLKAHLKRMYGLSEEKCQKFVIGKKSAIGDRPAIRRKEIVISWERIPFAMKRIRTNEDTEAQKATFLEVWNEDGATAEPDGDDWE